MKVFPSITEITAYLCLLTDDKTLHNVDNRRFA